MADNIHLFFIPQFCYSSSHIEHLSQFHFLTITTTAMQTIDIKLWFDMLFTIK